MSVLRLIIALAILAVTIEAGVNYPVREARNSPVKPQCGENEEYTNCGTACEPKCGDPEFMPCTRQCILNVCQCINGHARNSQGICIPKDQCGNSPVKPQCGENEEYTNCGTACEPKCGDPEFMPCTRQCILNVCQCINGHARNSQGICIPKDQCGKETSASGKNH